MSKSTTRICSIEGCDRPVRARGWCNRHWTRWRTHGDPLVLMRYATPEEALQARTRTVEGGCIIWTGSQNSRGYGFLQVRRRTVKAHRFAWEQAHGPIPEGAEVNHVCFNRRCVNPSHLELVTHAENSAYRAGASVSSRTGLRNVTLIPSGRYRVQIVKDSRKHHFGVYDTIDEAARVAAEARAELFGRYAGRG